MVYYAPLIFGNEVFFSSDHGFYFEPLTKFISNACRHLQLPLWNPLVHCGMSEIAVPSPSIFYPPNLLFVFLPYGMAFGWFMVLHQLAAGLCAMLLTLSFGWGGAAAVGAAIIVAFCGYMFSLSTNYTLMAAAAWVPLNFLVAQLLGKKHERKNTYLLVCLGALAFFLLISAGRPEVSVPVAFLIALFVLFQSLAKRATERPNLAGGRYSGLGWRCLFISLGLLLAMPVILPALEWLANSRRAQGLKIDEVFLWSANWYDFVSMVFAQPFGDLTALGSPYLNLAASRLSHLPFVPSPLIGPVAFTLAIWGFCDQKWREGKWLLTILLLSLLMILGKNAYIFPQLLTHLPCINLFRYPIKLIIIPIFVLAVGAARGLYCLSQSVDGSYAKSADAPTLASWFRCLRWNQIRGELLTSLLWSFVSLIGCLYIAAGLLSKPLPIHPLDKSAAAQLLLGESLVLGAVFGLITCGLALLLKTKVMNVRWTLLALNVILLLSLYVPALIYRAESVTSRFYTEYPFALSEIEKIDASSFERKNQRILLLYRDPIKLPPNYMKSFGVSRTINYDAYCRDLLLPNTNMDWDQPTTLGYEAAETADYNKVSYDLTQRISHISDDLKAAEQLYLILWRFCRATATNWVCTQCFNDKGNLGVLPDTEHFELVSESILMNLRIYKVKTPLSRAFVCKNWSWANSHNNVLDILSGATNSQFDPETAALIERSPDAASDCSVLLPPGCQIDKSSSEGRKNSGEQGLPPNAVLTQAGVIYSAAKIKNSQLVPQAPEFLKDLPEHISLSVNLDKDNFLILSDQFYPGWVAKIDGLMTPVFRANGCFRSVYVPRGGHLIQFDYEPSSLAFGLYAALFGLGIIAWLLLSVLWPHLVRWFRRIAGI